MVSLLIRSYICSVHKCIVRSDLFLLGGVFEFLYRTNIYLLGSLANVCVRCLVGWISDAFIVDFLKSFMIYLS